MIHRFRRTSFVALTALLTACGKGGETPQPASTPATPNVVRLIANEYSFQSPDTIPAGWTTFRLANHGQEVHYGHIIRLDSGRTVEELVDAYAVAIRTSGPRPKWVTRFGGPGGTAPGDSSAVTQYIEPGSYVWMCPIEDEKGNPHFGKGEFKRVVVRAAAGGVDDREAAPAASVVIRLTDFSFELDAPAPGRHTVRVENTGLEPHDLVLMKLAPGRTIEDILTWMNPERARRADQAGKPAPSLESLGTLRGGTAAIASGMRTFFDADFTAGDYALFCMATAPDGRSHIEHGMIRQISVRE